ncbi:response regulator [Herbaspirillum sp. HC18]|nr:response regulator [Herbaspirillum sp. HC18]
MSPCQDTPGRVMYINNEEAAARALAGDGILATGSLLAGMNHDIRTSMNGVLGMLELLLDTGLTPSQRQYARTARHSADTLLELLERIVELSLIESKQFRLSQTPVDLMHEMQAACASKNDAALEKGLELAVAYPPAVKVRGDAARLRELASGLIDVALRFSGSGCITVNIDTSFVRAGECGLTISVQAPNLSEEGIHLLPLLKQPSGQGVGALLGHGKRALELALCAQLARLMGGRIDVDDTVLRFSVDLPLAMPQPPAVRAIVIADRTHEWKALFSPFIAQGARIDVFDSATSGLAAIADAAARNAPYHAVMLEHHVQGMDASVFAIAIETDPSSRAPALVLLTDRTAGEMSLPDAGFSAQIDRSDAPGLVLATLGTLWSAAAGGRSTQAPKKADASGHGVPALPFSGRRVLLVDDNMVNQEVAARLLEKAGCKCDVAGGGAQAVEMQVAQGYELILMDCEMPEVDGFEATRRIRATESPARRTPIIALTACTGQGEREQCLAAGMDDFLSKPIRPQMLNEMLGRWLPGGAPETASASVCEDELEAIHDMFGADFAGLAALYTRDGAPRLAALREAHAAGDWTKAAKIAHALGGSSSSIGATGLSARCKDLELRAKAGTLEGFEVRMAGIESEYRRICDKLQSMLEG